MSTIKVAVIFGGESDEHQVSLISANGILKNLNPERYQVQKIGITRDGVWKLYRDHPFVNVDNPKTIALADNGIRLVLDMAKASDFFVAVAKEGEDFVPLTRPDVVFPILHGPYGEDGRIQGLFDMAHLPYVGAGVLGSTACMDKVVTKQLLSREKIPVGSFLGFHQNYDDPTAYDWKKVSTMLGMDLFVKPANLGSSVGISHAKTREEYQAAVELAFHYDKKIIVEKTIKGRELEVAVLGNFDPKATKPGEIRPHHDFYSYEAKYLDPNGAELLVPAPVKASVVKEIRELSIAAFKVLNLRGLARIDYFYDEKNDKLYLNEVNTMPGFTPISMFPKLWQLEGLSYEKLLDELITLALEPPQSPQA